MAYLVAQHTKRCAEEGCYLEGTVTLYADAGHKVGGFCNLHADVARQEYQTKEDSNGRG